MGVLDCVGYIDRAEIEELEEKIDISIIIDNNHRVETAS